MGLELAMEPLGVIVKPLIVQALCIKEGVLCAHPVAIRLAART